MAYGWMPPVGGQQQRGSSLFNNPMFQAAGLGFGSSLMSGLADLLGGETEEEKRRKQMFNLGMREYANQRDVFNPLQTAQRSYNATLPMINRNAAQVGKRSNLDSGVAQGAIQEMLYPQFMSSLSDLTMKNDLMKEDRRQNWGRSLMSMYGGGY